MTLANENPATLAARRAGNEVINGFEPFDASNVQPTLKNRNRFQAQEASK